MTPQGSVATGAALQYTQNVLGGPVVENDSNPTIGATVGTVIEGNGDRVGLVIINVGGNDLFIALDSGVSATNGIRLGANGGSVSMDVVNDFTMASRKWYGVAPTGNTNVFVLELARYALTPKGGR